MGIGLFVHSSFNLIGLKYIDYYKQYFTLQRRHNINVNFVQVWQSILESDNMLQLTNCDYSTTVSI